VYGFLLRLAGDRALADDLFQETWLRLARAAVRLAEDTNMAAWLISVARNLFRSHLRWRLLDRTRLRDLGLMRGQDSYAVSPLDSATAAESAQRLERALAGLPVKYREVLLLVGVEGMPNEDAARVLGVSDANLRQRLSRGRAMLAAGMGEMRPARAGEDGGRHAV
jgi:RNA polymerase sigma-70 factor (ECF subfamily)